MKKLFLVIVLLFFFIGAGYLLVVFNYSYSSGSRAGYIQKFSHKGWLCKTYEGELALYVVGGVSPQIWYFSVRDESLVPSLRKALGERVRLHYSEHPLVPTSCFAETRYFVEGVEHIKDSTIYQVVPVP